MTGLGKTVDEQGKESTDVLGEGEREKSGNKIDHDYRGNVYGKSKQVARCGNAVCPPMATALVRANLPEWCGEKISTMEELERAVAW